MENPSQTFLFIRSTSYRIKKNQKKTINMWIKNCQFRISKHTVNRIKTQYFSPSIHNVVQNGAKKNFMFGCKEKLLYVRVKKFNINGG